jgi:hypothetical protein
MTDPRVPPDEQEEAQLPDDLDQNPGIGQSKGLFGQHGSEDAQLLAGENTAEGDVENDAGSRDGAVPDDLGRTNV